MVGENNSQAHFNRLISGYLADQSDLSDIDPAQLTAFIEAYPYCQPLRFIEAALAYEDKGHDDLSKAALYAAKRETLYRIMKKPGGLQTREIDWPLPETARDIPEEELIPENIASSDFFTFEKRVEEPAKSPEPFTEPLPAENIPAEEVPAEKSAQKEFFSEEPVAEAAPAEQPPAQSASSEPLHSAGSISKYDDDKMPYTFLWWLSKTRKEHEHTYQPYASPGFSTPAPAEVKKNSGGELNHQILENIIQHGNAANAAPPQVMPKLPDPDLKEKEAVIIEKFIREEPQIKPLQADKIDAENKARKSSEDENDLVSETLARIYVEQMLFGKAIDTYRKLSLKLPEKRAYFADQIKELQRKI